MDRRVEDLENMIEQLFKDIACLTKALRVLREVESEDNFKKKVEKVDMEWDGSCDK